jgi:hypothetical protein
MKARTWMLGPAALVLALGMAGGASAKDNDVKTPVRLAAAEKPAKGAKSGKLTAKQIAAIEKLTGKTLTDDQKQQLAEANAEKNAAMKAANDKFQEQKAKILGLTPAELKAKEKEAAAKARAEKKAKKAAGG